MSAVFWNLLGTRHCVKYSDTETRDQRASARKSTASVGGANSPPPLSPLTESRVPAWNFVDLHSMDSSPIPESSHSIITPTLLTRKLKLREMKSSARSHANKRWSRDPSPRSLAPAPVARVLRHSAWHTSGIQTASRPRR